MLQTQGTKYLTPVLRGKALEAYMASPTEQNEDYEAISDAIICDYQLTPEEYHKKSRSLQKKNLQTSKQRW